MIASAVVSVVVFATPTAVATRVSVSDANLALSPYNWCRSDSGYIQTPNPGAYLKLGFTGRSIALEFDVSPLRRAATPAANYPLIRYSIDGGPAATRPLSPETSRLLCGAGLRPGAHSLLLQYVAGYVFLDFWTPVNVVRILGFDIDEGARTLAPFGAIADRPRNALFLGDSITNGDNTVTTFAGGVTNAVSTQDATLGYAPVVAAGIGAEYGIVAYGGASWEGTAADGHTPGLMAFFSMLDRDHSRLVSGKLEPVPDDVFVNMGENAGPRGDDVPTLLADLRRATSPATNLFVIVPFSGRSRDSLAAGVAQYLSRAKLEKRVYLIDLGNNPYLTDAGPTMFAVDGQHPLAALDAQLGAQIVQARADLLRAN